MGDIVIIGGGVTGCSIAYFLAEAGHAGDVCVVEPDPTYELAATPRSYGGIRQLFTVPENIRMSQFGHAFYAAFPERMQIDGTPADISYRRNGYLFLASGAEDARVMEANWQTQTACGARIDLLDRDGLKTRFPSLTVDDIDAAVHSPDDGWMDPYGVLMGFRRKAREMGVAFVHDRVTGLETAPGRVTAAALESGRRLAADIVVNAAGAWAPELCAMIGMPIPVEPMHRTAFYFELREPLEPFPLTKDTSGVSFRPEGRGYITGVTNLAQPAGFYWNVDHAYFDEVVWPRLAHRVRAFEALKVQRSWAGHYDQNRMDGNMILGPWVGGAENFYVACGFSGHGLQHAPAVGRAMKELLLDGGYRTIDLTRFGYQRVLDGEPLAESGIVA